MDSTNSSSVTDDQELAKVLEGMNQSAAAPAATPPASDSSASDGLAFEASPVPAGDTPPAVAPATPPPAVPGATPASPELDSIKKSALEELRPLVDKLDLPADEKFDTLLLIIRSTDDKSLVSAAHEAAKAIPDETKRAQALLDVIKEIDYFSGNGQQPQ